MMADDLISRQAVKDAFHAYMARRFDKDRCADAENCEVCERRCLWHEVVASVSAVDAVSRGLFEQIKWERDIAMEQLEEHGIAFGAKAECAVDVVEVVRCSECKDGGRCEVECLLREVDKIPDPYCAAGERRESDG